MNILVVKNQKVENYENFRISQKEETIYYFQIFFE